MLQVYDRVLPSRSIPTLVGLAVLVAMLLCLPRGPERDPRAAVRGSQLASKAAWPARLSRWSSLPLESSRAATACVRCVTWTRSAAHRRRRAVGVFRPALDASLRGHVLRLSSLARLRGARRRRRPRCHRPGDRPMRRAARSEPRLGLPAVSPSRKRRGETRKSCRRWAWPRTSGAVDGPGERDLQASADAPPMPRRAWRALAKVARLWLQSAVLAVGAYLVILREASAGVIIASSILRSRALAPIEQTIGNWRGFLAARQSWARLKSCSRRPPPSRKLSRPPPRLPWRSRASRLVAPGDPGHRRKGRFQCQGRPGLGIIGASASGKSTLARALVGVWPQRAARSASTAPRSTNGRARGSAATSAICRRMSSCSPGRWRRTSLASIRRPPPRRSSPLRSAARRPRADAAASRRL